MASNRHLGRIVALQTLYELDFRAGIKDATLDLDEILGRNIDRYKEVVEDKEFIVTIVEGVYSKSAELDAVIQPIAPDWPLDQIARIDKTILRIGVFEFYHLKAVPPKVVINEAVELAKSFGADNSSKFINGVLGTVLKKMDEATAESQTTEKIKTDLETKTKTKFGDKKPVKKPSKSNLGTKKT